MATPSAPMLRTGGTLDASSASALVIRLSQLSAAALEKRLSISTDTSPDGNAWPKVTVHLGEESGPGEGGPLTGTLDLTDALLSMSGTCPTQNVHDSPHAQALKELLSTLFAITSARSTPRSTLVLPILRMSGAEMKSLPFLAPLAPSSFEVCL